MIEEKHAPLPQFDILKTVFGRTINKYEPRIANVRVYGTPKNPLFMANDVSTFACGDSQPTARGLKKYSIPLELVKGKVINKNGVLTLCNLLTKYGLMRFISSVPQESQATVCFRNYIYSLFDILDSHVSSTKKITKKSINQILINHNNYMLSLPDTIPET